MVFSCLAAVLAASVAAYMAMVVLRQAQTLQVRHDNFCTFLATEISAASTPTLRPLVPALRAEHTNNACP